MYAEKLLRKQVESELKRRRYIVYTILLLGLFYVFSTIIFGDRGLMRNHDLSRKEASLKSEVAELNRKNDELRNVIETYGDNKFYIEKHARENFGLAEPGEFIYLYEDK